MKKSFLVTSIITNVLIIIVAVLGTVFVNIGMEWYMTLTKPTEWVPSIVFPIVWSVVYVMSAVVLYLWQKNGSVPTDVYILFIVNGILNVIWCLVFFTLHQLLFGVVVIVLNLIFAFVLISKLFKQSTLYGALLSIYPFWLCLATGLNVAVWILN